VTRPIGAASDYYRLRILHVGETDIVDLQWRDDILWRQSRTPGASESEVYVVQAVSVPHDDKAIVLAGFESAEDAHEALAAAQQDLQVLTRSEFEDRYFPPDG
jgi:hypothetical protein